MEAAAQRPGEGNWCELRPPVSGSALFECRRIPRPGGEIHLADWSRPEGILQRGGFFPKEPSRAYSPLMEKPERICYNE